MFTYPELINYSGYHTGDLSDTTGFQSTGPYFRNRINAPAGIAAVCYRGMPQMRGIGNVPPPHRFLRRRPGSPPGWREENGHFPVETLSTLMKIRAFWAYFYKTAGFSPTSTCKIAGLYRPRFFGRTAAGSRKNPRPGARHERLLIGVTFPAFSGNRFFGNEADRSAGHTGAHRMGIRYGRAPQTSLYRAASRPGSTRAAGTIRDNRAGETCGRS
jgi:hypothetical protein